jgi:hypothetical protein
MTRQLPVAEFTVGCSQGYDVRILGLIRFDASQHLIKGLRHDYKSGVFAVAAARSGLKMGVVVTR